LVLSASSDPPIKVLVCKSCGGDIRLEYRPGPAGTPMWCWFDCPHCQKPAFQHLPGPVVQVTKLPSGESQ